MNCIVNNQEKQNNQSNKYQWIDCGNYWELNAPQGDDIWKEGRIGRVTSSVSGALAGNSIFKTPEEQGLIIAGVKEEQFSPAALERMTHGTKSEAPARMWYQSTIGKPIRERGLIVSKTDPILGASVDGDIVGGDDEIIEIKCPLSMYYPIEQYIDQLKTGWVPGPNYFKHIWPSHYDQIQHALKIMDKKYCNYIVYCTTESKVFTQKIPFNPEYWDQHYQKLKENYEKYVKPHLNGKYPIMPESFN